MIIVNVTILVELIMGACYKLSQLSSQCGLYAV